MSDNELSYTNPPSPAAGPAPPTADAPPAEDHPSQEDGEGNTQELTPPPPPRPSANRSLTGQSQRSFARLEAVNAQAAAEGARPARNDGSDGTVLTPRPRGELANAFRVRMEENVNRLAGVVSVANARAVAIDRSNAAFDSRLDNLANKMDNVISATDGMAARLSTVESGIVSESASRAQLLDAIQGTIARLEAVHNNSRGGNDNVSPTVPSKRARTDDTSTTGSAAQTPGAASQPEVGNFSLGDNTTHFATPPVPATVAADHAPAPARANPFAQQVQPVAPIPAPVVAAPAGVATPALPNPFAPQAQLSTTGDYSYPPPQHAGVGGNMTPAATQSAPASPFGPSAMPAPPPLGVAAHAMPTPPPSRPLASAPAVRRGGNNRPGIWVAIGPMNGLGRGAGQLNSQFEDLLRLTNDVERETFLAVRRSSRRGARLMANATWIAGFFDDIEVAMRFRDAWNRNVPVTAPDTHAEVVAEASLQPHLEPNTFYSISVRSWNVRKRLADFIQNEDSCLQLERYDVNFFQETGLTPGQERSLRLPRGYECIAISRPAGILLQQGGGLAVIFREGLFEKCDLLPEYGGQDVMALDVGFAVLLNAYLPPSTSPWLQRAGVRPIAQLAEALALGDRLGKRMLLVGDLNARTASSQPQPDCPTRLSFDSVTTARGTELIDVLRATDTYILNGCEDLGQESGAYTSFNSDTSDVRHSVVDYLIANNLAAPYVLDLEILPRLGKSDHAPMRFTLGVRGSELLGDHEPAAARARRRPHRRPDLPMHSELDKAYAAAIQSAQDSTPETRMFALYGCAATCSRETIIHTDGSCHSNGRQAASAGAGVYFGESGRNLAVRVPGAQTNNRAEVYAILRALAACDPHRSLAIFTDSQYAIRSLTYWAASRENTGWLCANGDILRNCAEWLKARTATTRFEYVQAHKGNHGNESADRLANKGADDPSLGVFVPIPPPTAEPARPGTERIPKGAIKVSTSLPPAHDPEGRCTDKRRPAWKDKGQKGRRGRNRKHWTQNKHQDAIVAASRAGKPFWRTWRRCMDAKKRRAKVSLTDLAATFRRRMNRNAEPPDSFILSARVQARHLARRLEDITPDIPPDDTFTREWVPADIASLKAKIKSDAKAGAPGVDGIATSVLMMVPNEALCDLFNQCVRKQGAPSIWLLTAVIGILKKNLSPKDAASYRTIGLESIALKMMTLLIHKRLYAWAERHKIFPASQNGFRHGYRTNNNVFILRSIIEKYQDSKLPVYVAFVDISNAFPSTDRDILWLTLQRQGCVGPIVDWLRMLYSNMRYVVQLEDEFSDAFASDIGVLIGDPSSPTLWNLFISDFKPPAHPDDPILGSQNIRVSHVEHADDMQLIALGADGLQALLDYLYRWAGEKQLLVNSIKTWIMMFGKIPKNPPIFRLGGLPLKYTATHTYVGVHIRSTTGNIFAPHYSDIAAKARGAALAILAGHSVFGDLPPETLRLLYLGRVDPHLCSGADIMVDVDRNVEKIMRVQHEFLRRSMGIFNNWSPRTPLFTELNVWPIRYRRLTLALRYLRYLLQQDDSRLVRAALEEQIAMYDATVAGFLGDLRIAFDRLPVKVSMPSTADIRANGTVDNLINAVSNSMRESLRLDIATSPRLYLLRDRPEPQARGPPRPTLMRLRHYLKIRNADDRSAMAKLMISSHPLAIERFRHGSGVRNGVKRLIVPREERLCRLCAKAVESPEHAVLVCNGSDALKRLRGDFYASLHETRPDFVRPYTEEEALIALRTLICAHDICALLAAFVNKTLKLFGEVELVWPSRYTIRVDEDNVSDEDEVDETIA
ncbi:unnamed protein product [Peniophora sp. CBMAI 1063]|nr:unnamed protein product [Peniophora sp. CBMAI 1063]